MRLATNLATSSGETGTGESAYLSVATVHNDQAAAENPQVVSLTLSPPWERSRR